MSKQQKQFDVVMVNVREILYSEYGLKAALDIVRGAKEGPAQGIGIAASNVLKSVYTGLKQKGKNADQKVVAGALAETVADITELCVSAGLVPEEQKQEIGKAAMGYASQALKSPAKPSKPPQPQQPAPQGLVQNAMGA